LTGLPRLGYLCAIATESPVVNFRQDNPRGEVKAGRPREAPSLGRIISKKPDVGKNDEGKLGGRSMPKRWVAGTPECRAGPAEQRNALAGGPRKPPLKD